MVARIMEQPMRLPVLSGLLAVLLLGGVGRAQDNSGPWQDCDFPEIGITVDSNALLPGIPEGRRLTAICFTHAIRGSSLSAGQVRIGSLSPPIARGDLVAFRRPGDLSKTTIRRVIGLPGDRVQLRDYRVLINDTMLQTDRLGDAQVEDGEGQPRTVVRLHETVIPRIRGYDILLPQDTTDGSGTSLPFIVPLRAIFVLPDNRAAAGDFRAPVSGIVPVVNLIARLTVPAGK
jgi:signal peptidase I